MNARASKIEAQNMQANSDTKFRAVLKTLELQGFYHYPIRAMEHSR
jgi:hypothetical protein